MKRTRSKNGSMVHLQAAGLTDRGRHRQVNEDAIFYQSGQTPSGDKAGLYMVCDGLGGLQAGEIASRLAVETVAGELMAILFSPDPTLSESRLPQYIQTAITTANARIREYAEGQAHPKSKLGTTITLLLIYGGVAHIANVGDSRAYLSRNEQVTQLTEDHSLAAAFARVGKIDRRYIVDHPRRNVLLQALGTQEKVNIDLYRQTLASGDSWLLCSDGLWQAFPDAAELSPWLEQVAPSSAICEQLVAEANRRAGSDDVSVVVVQVDKMAERQGEPMDIKTPVAIQDLSHHLVHHRFGDFIADPWPAP